MQINKTTKGGLAVGAAAVLLLGGAGSLAFWTDAATLNGGSITSGSLKLTDPTCDESFTYATGAAGAGKTAKTVVPGDKITKTCTFKVTATGDNLKATLDTPAATFSPTAAGSSLTLTPSATYKLGATDLVNGGNTITSADNGKTVTAVIKVDIPFGTNESGNPKVNANDTQLATATLNALTVTATQVTS